MSLAKRGALAVSMAAALMTALPSPALAEPDEVTMGLYFPDVLVAAGSEGTIEYATVMPSAPVVLHDFTVTFDSSGLAGVATISTDSSTCTSTSTTLTCVSPFPETFFDNQSILPDVLFKPEPGAPVGASGELKVKISATDFPGTSATATVTVGEGVDLVAGPSQELEISPGAGAPAKLEVSNVGPPTADGAVVVFYGDYAIQATKSFSNCFYNDGRIRACVFDEQLMPSTAYRTKEDLPLALRPDTHAPGVELLEISWTTVAEFVLLRAEIQRRNPDWLGEPGTGSELDLVEVISTRRSLQVDPDPSNNWSTVDIRVTGDNPVDLVAIGGSASGEKDVVVTLDLGLKNLGPATIDNGRSGESPGAARIELPAGASLAEMPDGCMAWKADDQPDDDPGNLAARIIVCWIEDYLFTAGTEKTFAVKLRIDEVIDNATGKVKVVIPGCSECEVDDNPAGNTADIILNATGGSGGGLPVTGVRVGLFGALGGLLLAAGAAMYLLARRRRLSV